MDTLRTPEVNELLTVLSELKDPDTIYALLQDLFTVREIRDTSQRLQVARMLANKNPYTAIEAATGASATTIARVSKCLGYGAGGYAAALEVLEQAGEAAGGEALDGEAAGQAGEAAAVPAEQQGEAAGVTAGGKAFAGEAAKTATSKKTPEGKS